jgi:WD40 repeat protein
LGHVFISYSRRDSEFVYRLREAVIEAGHRTWLDKEKIPPSDLWLARIKSAIDEAEAVVFVLSPASLASEVCGKELDYAFSRNKRVIPVVWRDPEGEVRGDIAEINYVFLRESDDFEAGLADLTEAIETDLDWVRAHTRLLVRAVEWDRLGREVSYTLRGRDLKDFEDRAARGQDLEPRLTALQTEYLLASRRAVARRQRVLWSAGALALMVAAVLGTIAWFQNAERARQAEIVAARALLSRSEAARDAPRDESSARVSHTKALRLAAQALARLVSVEAPVADADLALRKSYANLEKWRNWELPHPRIAGSDFSPGGRHLARYHLDGDIVVRDTFGDAGGFSCRRTANSGESDVTVSASADGTRVALAFGTRGDDESLNAVEVWDVPGCKRLLREALPQYSPMELGRDGRLLTAAPEGSVRIWNLDSGEPHVTLASLRAVRRAALSPDSAALVILSRERGSRTSSVQVVDSGSGAVRNRWSPDGRVEALDWVAGGILVYGREVASLLSPDLELLHEIPLPPGELTAVSEDGRLVAAATRKGRVRVVDVQTGEAVAEDDWRDGISRLAFGPAGHSVLVAGDYYRFQSAWHFLDRGAFASLEASGPAEGLEFRDGGLEAWTGAGAAVWDLSADGPPRLSSDTLGGFSPPEPAPATGGSRAGSDLSVSSARSGHEAAIVAGEMTRAGPRRRLVVREDGMEILGRDYQPVLDVDQAAFLTWAGNDRYLVVGTRAGLEILDAATLNPAATIYHANAIRAGVAADGRSAATMDVRGRIKVWDVAEGTQRLEIETRAEISALALSDDGRWLAGLAPGGRILLWALTPGDLIEQACRWLEPPCP